MIWFLHSIIRTSLFFIMSVAADEIGVNDIDPMIIGIFLAAAIEEIARAIQIHRGWTPPSVYLMMGTMLGIIEGETAFLIFSGIIGHTAYGFIYEILRRKWKSVGIISGLILTTLLHASYNSSPSDVQAAMVIGETLVFFIVGTSLLRDQ